MPDDSEDIENRNLTLISATRVDNLYANMKKRDSPHLLWEPIPYQPSEVIQRLMRLNQRYKREIHHAINLVGTEFEKKDF